MADKTIALKIAIEGNQELKQLQANFDNTRKELQKLNKLEKENKITSEQASKARAGLNVELKANRNALTDQQNALLKNNDALKKNSGFVAGVKKGVGQWATSMIGVTAGIALVSKGITDAVERIKKFDSAVKNLSAITGATGKDLEYLKKQAIDLGSKTTLAASEVADAFTVVGSQRPELLKNGEALSYVTEQAIILAEAAKIDMSDAAKAVTTSLNQMSLSADETSRVVNVLAAGSKEGSADIPYLNAAIEKAGAVSRDANLSFEEMVGAIETIAPSLSDPSSAGLQFRDVLLRLQTSGKGFQSGQFNLKDALTQVKGELDSIQDPAKRAAEETNLFGKVSLVTGKALLNNIDTFENYTEAVTGTNTALEQQKVNNDTLEGSLKMLDSAYEGLILSFEDGSGILSQTFKTIVDDLSRTLGMISALNSEDPLSALTEGAINYANKLGFVNDEQTKTALALNNNKDVVEELNRRLENGSIDSEQYAKAIDKIASGWKRASTEIADTQITPDAVSTGGETTYLTDEEEKALKKKAEERAKKLAELKKEAEQEQSQYDSGMIDEEVDFNFENELENLRIQNEQRLVVDQEFIDQKRQMHEEAMNHEFEVEKRNAENTKKLEQLKRDARQQTLSAIGSIFGSISSLMKEGSEEQKAIASAMALLDTYLAINKTLAAFAGVPIPGYAIAQSIAIGVQGFANVARINGVQFADGGILSGASHANGGIPFTINGQGGFEAEGGEAIINKRSTAMFTPLLSAINEAGGGNRLFADGGLVPNTGGLNSSQSLLQSANNQGDLAEIIASSIGSIEVVNVATNTSDVATEVTNISNNATF